MKAHNAMKAIAHDLGVNDLYRLYRAVYKGTECGPSIGVQLNNGNILYCDSLRAVGSFDEMEARRIYVATVMISSIVEGCDAEVPTRHMTDANASILKFYELVEEVDTEADEIWQEVHGSEES